MHTTTRARCLVSALAVTAILGRSSAVFAQTEGVGRELPLASADSATNRAPERSSIWKSLFTDTARDVRHLPSRTSAEWLVIGGVLAFGAHTEDNQVGRSLSSNTEFGETVRPGAVLGSTPFQLAGATATLLIGHLTNHPRVAHVGGNLIRAQLVAEGLTVGIKQAVRRNRPEGSGFSFPSGHTTVSFASATVLQRHFGWRVGVPAYAVAGYVAVSRVQMRRHYLSDVAFGAALGIVAGRAISLGHERAIELSPMATPGGAGLSFTWIKRKPS